MQNIRKLKQQASGKQFKTDIQDVIMEEESKSEEDVPMARQTNSLENTN